MWIKKKNESHGLKTGYFPSKEVRYQPHILSLFYFILHILFPLIVQAYFPLFCGSYFILSVQFQYIYSIKYFFHLLLFFAKTSNFLPIMTLFFLSFVGLYVNSTHAPLHFSLFSAMHPILHPYIPLFFFPPSFLVVVCALPHFCSACPIFASHFTFLPPVAKKATFLRFSFVCATYGFPKPIGSPPTQCYSYGGDRIPSRNLGWLIFWLVSFVTRVWLCQQSISCSPRKNLHLFLPSDQFTDPLDILTNYCPRGIYREAG